MSVILYRDSPSSSINSAFTLCDSYTSSKFTTISSMRHWAHSTFVKSIGSRYKYLMPCSTKANIDKNETQLHPHKKVEWLRQTPCSDQRCQSTQSWTAAWPLQPVLFGRHCSLQCRSLECQENEQTLKLSARMITATKPVKPKTLGGYPTHTEQLVLLWSKGTNFVCDVIGNNNNLKGMLGDGTVLCLLSEASS